MVKDGGKLLRIEVKASGRPRLADAAALRSFRREYGEQVRTGLLLRTGQERRVARAGYVGGAVVKGGVMKLAIRACWFALVMAGSISI